MMFGKAMAALAASFAVAGAAAADPSYPRMAPVDAYLMDRTQEIALARTAAPAAITKDATILVMTRTGYETAVTGTNGFACLVGRSFNGAPDAAERWNPKIRAAECLNPQAARSVLPFARLRAAMVLAGKSDAEYAERIRAAVKAGEIPPLEPGAMSYMMSRSSYLSDDVHDMPHLMFFVTAKDADWGANAPNSPLFGGNYWFYTPGHEAEAATLPPLSVFLTQVANWSDGTPAPAHRM